MWDMGWVFDAGFGVLDIGLGVLMGVSGLELVMGVGLEGED